MDEQSGVMLNPDMELYKLAGATDIPEIIVEAYDTPAMRRRGVIGAVVFQGVEADVGALAEDLGKDLVRGPIHREHALAAVRHETQPPQFSLVTLCPKRCSLSRGGAPFWFCRGAMNLSEALHAPHGEPKGSAPNR